MTIGEVHWVELPPSTGHEQSGRRPAVIIQDDAYAGKLPVVTGNSLMPESKWRDSRSSTTGRRIRCRCAADFPRFLPHVDPEPRPDQTRSKVFIVRSLDGCQVTEMADL